MIKFVLVVLAWSACLTGDGGGLVSAERTESLPQPPVTWNKKLWSEYIPADQARWAQVYALSHDPVQDKLWERMSVEEKEDFAWKISRPTRQMLGQRRRDIRNKLISLGRYNPEEGELVFKNPFKLLEWSINLKPKGEADNVSNNEKDDLSALRERATLLKKKKAMELELERLRKIRQLHKASTAMKDEPIEEDIKGKENDVNEDDEDMHVNHANEWDFEDKEGEKKDPLLPEIAKNLLTTVDRLSKVPFVSNLLEAVIPPELAPKQNALGARSIRPGGNGMGLMGMMKFYNNMKTIGVAMTSVGLTALEMTDLSISVLDNLPFGIQVPEVVKFLEHAYDFMDFGVEMMDMMI